MKITIKKLTVALLLLFCCVTFIPMFILLLQASDGYEYSILKKLLKELE